MENDNNEKEQVVFSKKSKDIVISQNLLNKIVIAVLTLVCVYLIFTYFDSGLTHKKAAQVFMEYWEKHNTEKIEGIKVLGIKKIKADTYRVKIEYSYWGWPAFAKKYELLLIQLDLIYTKWDTGWFIEEKKK